MAQDPQLQAIIDRALAAGLSDEDIRGLADEHRARQMTSTPPPAKATLGVPPQSTMTGDPMPPPARDIGIMDLDRAMETSRGLRAEAWAHPIRTAAMIAAPGIVAKTGRLVSPYIGPTLTKAGQFLEQPLVGGGLGAMHGFERGGLGGAVEQGLYGAVGGSVLGRALTAAGNRLSPVPPPPPSVNVGGRLVPRSTPPMQQAVAEGLAASRVPPPVSRVSLPEQGPGPVVTLSPQAQRAAAGRPLMEDARRPVSPGIVQPATVGPPRAPGIVAEAPRPVAPAPVPPPSAASAAGPRGSKSKTAKHSENDLKVYANAIKNGLSEEDAVVEMLRQRELRAVETYARHKQIAEERRKAAGGGIP